MNTDIDIFDKDIVTVIDIDIDIDPSLTFHLPTRLFWPLARRAGSQRINVCWCSWPGSSNPRCGCAE